MSVFRCFCSVISLTILFQFAQGSEPPQELNLSKAPAETLDRLKEKLAENVGRDAFIECVAKEVNKTFMYEKWGETTFEFSGPKELTISSTPPVKKEFREWLIQHKPAMERGYVMKEKSENQLLFPFERNPGVESPTLPKPEPIDEVPPPTFMHYFLGLFLPSSGNTTFSPFACFNESYQNFRSAFLLMHYTEIQQRYASNTLYEKGDHLIWNLVPKNKSCFDQILLMIDKQSLQLVRLRFVHPGKSTYDEFKIISYELK